VYKNACLNAHFCTPWHSKIARSIGPAKICKQNFQEADSSVEGGMKNTMGHGTTSQFFFIVFVRYTIPSKNIHTSGTPAAQNLQGTIRNCMNHLRQRERQSSRKQSRRGCSRPLRGTLLWTTFPKASSTGRSALLSPCTITLL